MPAINDLVISFGASGAAQPVTIAEQVYTGMAVGFGSVTQSRWRSNIVTVGGINFTLFPGIDSDGRCDLWIYAAYGEAPVQQTYSAINREHAGVDLQVSVMGVAQNLFGAGTTYSYEHQRSTWLRWQSSTMAWDTSASFINAKIADGTFLRHDSRNVFAALEDAAPMPTTNTSYQPFKVFGDKLLTQYIGDQQRGATGGGERFTIGPCHESFAHLIAEVATNNNPTWLTPSRLQVLQNLAETAAQFPHASGLLEPVTNRLLDPSVKPHCSHNNPVAWFSATGIPQPKFASDSSANNFDCEYDNSHPLNKISFHAWHLSKDPLHLLQVQGQAVCALTFQSLNANARGADGKTLNIAADQERGIWWGLQMLFQAWHATPAGSMPKPFRDKAWFAAAIDSSLQFLRANAISSTTHIQPGVVGEAMRFWRVASTLGTANGESYASHFQEDYGHIVLAQALMLGYSGARDIAEWHITNIQRRIEAGGSWFLNDYDLELTGFSGYAMGPATGALPYTVVAGFRAWYPRKTNYTNGPTVSAANWLQQYGRDTYLFIGAVNLNKEAVQRGLLTPGFDIAAAEAELRARFVGPFVSPFNGNPLNYGIQAKQYFSYATSAAVTPPTTTPPGDNPMKIADCVIDSTTVTGTGTATLANAPPLNSRAFSIFPTGSVVPYRIAHRTLNEWENGFGTVGANNTLARPTVTSSSNNGALVNFSAGVKDVMCDVTAGMLARYTSADNAVATTVDDVTTWMIPLYDQSGVPRLITIANLLASIGKTAAQLADADPVADADYVTLNQGGVDKKLTALGWKTYNAGGAGVPASDTTAPTLTNPTGTATGTTTASGTVSTNEANGTLYFLAATTTSATAAAVKAGSSQAVSASGSKAVAVTGLTQATVYYMHFLHRDAAGNDSAVASSASFTTTAAGDTTAPVLTVPLGTQTGSTTASGGVTTNEANGTLYRMVSANATETAATVKAANLTTAVSTTGALSVSFTGLTATTQYYAHYVHRDAAGNDSNVAHSAAFTTAAAAPVTAYTVTGYAGNAVKATLDISNATNFPTYNGYRSIIPANTGSSAQYPIYWAINATSGGAQPASAKAGWSTSSTVPPDDSVMTYLAGNTNASVLPGGAAGVYVTMTKGVAFDIGNLTLWVPAGAGTVTRSLWLEPVDGAPQMVGTITITGA